MAVTKNRLAKATDLIVKNRVAFHSETGELSVASTSGLTYRVYLYLGAEDSAWRCNCDWGRAHSYEAGNECSHALAARYYAGDNELTAADLGVTDSTEQTDPWAGL